MSAVLGWIGVVTLGALAAVAIVAAAVIVLFLFRLLLQELGL